jgi:hypothetical protein
MNRQHPALTGEGSLCYSLLVACAPDNRIFNRFRFKSLVALQSHRKGSYGMDHRPHIAVVEDETTQRRLLVDYLTR